MIIFNIIIVFITTMCIIMTIIMTHMYESTYMCVCVYVYNELAEIRGQKFTGDFVRRTRNTTLQCAFVFDDYCVYYIRYYFYYIIRILHPSSRNDLAYKAIKRSSIESRTASARDEDDAAAAAAAVRTTG